MKRFSLALLFCVAAFSASYGQDLKLPALSPTSKIIQEFSTSSIEISYSRPAIRGRKIFGGLVAYNEVWRTGANAATKVKFGEDVSISGFDLKAGEYALYTVPGEAEWEIIFNKGTGNWGASGYDKADDVARFKVKPKTMDKKVQSFTININNITFNSCNIELAWENTRVVLPVKADNEERINNAIDKAINEPNIPYFRAAAYYYETNQSMDKAYTYVNKAVEENPKAFYMWHLKAKIAQKLGKKDEAIQAAQKSIETAKGSANEAEYTRNNNKIIKALKG